MEGNVIPLQYIYDVIPWYFSIPKESLISLNMFYEKGWELITIHNNLAYFRRINPAYLSYLDTENRRRMSRKMK